MIIAGGTATVLSSVRTVSWTDVEFVVAIMFRYFTDLNAFNGIDPNWNAAPSTDYGVNVDLQNCFTCVARGSIPPQENVQTKFITGPRLTFWPRLQSFPCSATPSHGQTLRLDGGPGRRSGQPRASSTGHTGGRRAATTHGLGSRPP